MKYMKTVNELQAKLTKLRGEIQRSEAPKCICPPKTVYPHGGDCPVHGKLTWQKAGKCTCIKKDEVDIDCPEHGSRALDESIKEYVLKPDLPLRVRVARALGMKPSQITGVSNTYWGYQRKGYWLWDLVPDYPNDLVAAMGALEEYKEKAKTCPIKIQLNTYSDGKRWFVTIPFDCNDEKNIMECFESLPQAICEAIAAHAEQQ